MDDLYDNLDNYNEEHRIAELQSENKELKSKLEDHALTLETLQKEFDKLSSEYKILEKNYSSLLKTAKAEIERKTQTITNLNLEKDKMVLSSYHNRNASFVNRRKYDEPKGNKDSKSERDSKMKATDSGMKQSAHTAIDRTQQADSSKDTTALKTNVTARLLDMANSGKRKGDPRVDRNNDVTESAIQLKNDNMSMSTAPIRNSRKSMPAVSMEMEKFSTDDDDIASNRSYKELSKEHTDTRHVDHKSRERKSSRISETSCLEDRKYGYHESLSDGRNSRSISRYDNDRVEKYRIRDKSSHRLNRHSPDQYRRGAKDYHHDPYYRSEPGRYKAIGSPTEDRYHWRRSREEHRNNNEKNYHEHERLQHRSQEKHAKKHKIQHSNDKSDNKKMRMELDYRQCVENQRLQDEKDFLENKVLADPFPANVQFSSCESPDYHHPEVSAHQVREIKLIATTKLEDPRTSNKKYTVKKDDGKLTLSTTEGRNVEIVPINKTAWGNIISLPKALAKRPPLETKPTVKEMQTEIANPVANLTTELGEVSDLNGLESQNKAHEIDESKVLKKHGKEKHLKTINASKIVESSQKLNHYKIPKQKKTIDERQSHKNTKESTLLEKVVLENVSGDKSESSEYTIKDTVKNKSIKPEKQHETALIQNNNELPFLGSSDLYEKPKYGTASKVVEGDLELSDDNCDNNEVVSKEKVTYSKDKKDKDQKDKDQSCNFKTGKYSTDASEVYDANVKCSKSDNTSGETKLERVAVEPCMKDKATDDGKKSKNKKKLKLKESETKDLGQSSEATRKKMGKESKTNQIKTKFSELFDDSNSLIFPEDLGLTAVPTSTNLLPDECIPFLEDSHDAADSIAKKHLADSKNPIVEGNKHSINKTKSETITTINQDSVEIKNDVQPEINKKIMEVIYKNLEPGIPEKEDVKTVIISTGVQSPISLENQVLAHKTDPQVKTIQNIQEVSLKALATSTPHKTWPNVVQAHIEANVPNTSCNSNDSVMASVDNTPPLNISQTNTLDSQTNDTNVPDVRIFVKRRRKVIKK